ncbi:hypothetical protein J6590_104765 [Homalodisca vitripennis]|nr:hypothetical protein J6590_104765 [Homalodisca vitripennis]
MSSILQAKADTVFIDFIPLPRKSDSGLNRKKKECLNEFVNSSTSVSSEHRWTGHIFNVRVALSREDKNCESWRETAVHKGRNWHTSQSRRLRTFLRPSSN